MAPRNKSKGNNSRKGGKPPPSNARKASSIAPSTKKKKKIETPAEPPSDSESSSASSSSPPSAAPVESARKENGRMKAKKRSEEDAERSVSDDDSSESSAASSSSTKDVVDKDDGAWSSEGDEGEDGENPPPAPFSDQNSSWLKPKKREKKSEGKKQANPSNLLESDESDDDDDDGADRDSNQESASGSDDHDGESEEDDDLLDVEREALALDQEMEEERHEAQQEMQRTIRDHTSVYHLPTAAELERNVDRVVPPSEIRSHIDSILEVLSDFKTRREPGRSRKEYVDVLATFMAEQYGYLPELVEYFLTMFGPAEALAFVEESDKPRPLVIRTNTLKARRKDLAAALMKRGVNLDPLASWSKVGLRIADSPVPIGATPEYLSGHYMLQSAASMCAVMALSPEPNERVLDVSAAPGGKTSYLAQLMRNTGVIVANDLKAERQKATVANLHRLGVRNAIACRHDGRKMGELFRNRFDRILLDAPCSGLGVISRDPSVKVQRTLADVHKCAHLQKEMLLAAIDALKFKGTTGGVMVYSTCSVSVAENEEVVNYALSKRDVRLVDAGLEFGRPGFTRFQDKRFHPSVALTRRFYPHVHNMDGFFVAKFQKVSDGRPGQDKTAVPKLEEIAEGDTPADDHTKAGDRKEKASLSKGVGNKRRRSDEADDRKEKAKPGNKVSVPPVKPKAKKPKQNSKVTKPRRNRAATDA